MAAPGSPLAGALDPHAAWDVSAVIAAERFDQFNMFAWSLGGQKGPQPRPLWRPWADADRNVQVFRGDPLSMGEAEALAARYRSTERTSHGG